MFSTGALPALNDMPSDPQVVKIIVIIAAVAGVLLPLMCRLGVGQAARLKEKQESRAGR